MTGSASRHSAVARAAPISRGSVQDAPVSRREPDVGEGQQEARLSAGDPEVAGEGQRPAPAPAAMPLTAAMTGFGIVARAVTIGL